LGGTITKRRIEGGSGLGFEMWTFHMCHQKQEIEKRRAKGGINTKREKEGQRAHAIKGASPRKSESQRTDAANRKIFQFQPE